MPKNLRALLRYRAIDNCLRSRQRFWKWEELAEACAEYIELYENFEINVPSERTIKGDIRNMRSGKLGYEAPIATDHKRGYYYADPDFSIDGLRLDDTEARLLRQALDWMAQFENWRVIQGTETVITRLHEALRTRDARVRPAVQFDQLAGAPGQQWINPLYEAIVERRCLLLDYRSFQEPPLKSIISPYLLKEYNKRWFLIGFCATARKVHTFPLDRIHAVEPAPANQFHQDPDFNPATRYHDLVGVSKPYDAEPQEVLIWAAPLRSKYLVSKPLHHSQTTVERSPEGTLFSFRLIVNFEFLKLLLSFGDEIEVLQPAALRTEIAERHRAAARRYFPDLLNGN